MYWIHGMFNGEMCSTCKTISHGYNKKECPNCGAIYDGVGAPKIIKYN